MIRSLGNRISPSLLLASTTLTLSLAGATWKMQREREAARRKSLTAPLRLDLADDEAPAVPAAATPIVDGAAKHTAAGDSAASLGPAAALTAVAPASAADTSSVTSSSSSSSSSSAASEASGAPASAAGANGGGAEASTDHAGGLAAEEDADAPPARPIEREARPAGDRHPFVPEVTQLVFESFDELVLQADKDVVVQVFQHNCRACEALGPRVRMLAQLLQRANLSVPTPVIAVLDSNRNWPLPAAVQTRAFPIIAMFPKGKKDAPVMVRMLEKEEGGKRGLPTVPELLYFVHDNAGASFPLTPEMLATAEAMEVEAQELNNLQGMLGFYEGFLEFLALEVASGRIDLLDEDRAQLDAALAKVTAVLKPARFTAEWTPAAGSVPAVRALLPGVEAAIITLAAEAPLDAGLLRYLLVLARMIESMLPFDVEDADHAEPGPSSLRLHLAIATLLERVDAACDRGAWGPRVRRASSDDEGDDHDGAADGSGGGDHAAPSVAATAASEGGAAAVVAGAGAGAGAVAGSSERA